MYHFCVWWGSDSGGISRLHDGIKPFHLVTLLDNIAINKCPRWGGGNRTGDRVAAWFLGWGKFIFLGLGGDRYSVAFCDDGIKPFHLVGTSKK